MSETGGTDRGTVHVEVDTRPEGRVAYITMENPGRLNAGSPALIAALTENFEKLAGDDALRCVILSGAGDRAFMAGADISWLNGMTRDTGRAFITSLHRASAAIRALPVPVIGRLKGYCLGGGLELAAACDFRVADDSLVMGMPEVKVGLPSVIEAALLPGLIGWGKTRELLLTGANYDARAASAMGFVERLVAADEIDAVVGSWVDQILANGPIAVRSQKALISKWEKLDLDAAIEVGIDHFADAYLTDEPNRLMAPFLKKRS
jgi:enoyl-CoA hydratase/carnithine racemase